MALSRKERYATDPEYRERIKAQVKARAERKKARGLTDEEKEKRRIKNREDARRRRANTEKRLADNAKRREKYVTDEHFREAAKESARSAYWENPISQNMLRQQRKHGIFQRDNQRFKAVSGWRWAGVSMVADDGGLAYMDACDWYERWFDTLDDESAESVWE